MDFDRFPSGRADSPRATRAGLNVKAGATQLASTGCGDAIGLVSTTAATTAATAPNDLTQRFFTAIRQASSYTMVAAASDVISAWS